MGKHVRKTRKRTCGSQPRLQAQQQGWLPAELGLGHGQQKGFRVGMLHGTRSDSVVYLPNSYQALTM